MGKMGLKYFKCLIVAVLILMPLSLCAADYKVESFTLQLTDLTEVTEKDDNDNPYALIKVRTTIQDLEFDAGKFGGNTESGSLKMVKKTGEVWLYLPAGSKKITIKHNTYGTLDVVFNEENSSIKGLEPNGKYLMVLSSVNAPVQSRKRYQYVEFDVYPKDAIIIVEDNLYALESESEGAERGSKRIGPFLVGDIHDYKVSAEGFHAETGSFVVSDDVINVRIDLLSSKAQVNVSCDMDDADIYADDQKVGRGTWSGQMLNGWHVFESRREGYSSVSKEVFVTENGIHNVVLPSPIPIYGSLDINVKPEGADFLIDDVPGYKSPTFINEILVGKHVVKVSKDGYKDAVFDVNVKKDSISSVLFDLKRNVISTGPKKTGGNEWKPTFYAGACVGYGNGIAARLQIGVVERSFDLEVSFTKVFDRMTVNWTQSLSTEGGYKTDVITYRYSRLFSASLTAGYQFTLFDKIVVTPKIGCTLSPIKGICTNKPQLYSRQSSWVLCWLAGARVGYDVGKHASLFLDSGYGKPYVAGNLISDTQLLLDWNKGVSLMLGVNYSF